MPVKHKCNVVIFAHNIGKSINNCVQNVLLSSDDLDLTVFILANGCTDNTKQNVEREFAHNKQVQLINIPIADKANAWNHYIHKLSKSDVTHIFIDGDVVPELGAIACLTKCLIAHPQVNAVGAIPNVGRDRIGWTKRMIQYGRISGGLYALSDTFVSYLASNKIAIPIGFVGEDFLLSAWAKDLWGNEGLYQPNAKLLIEKCAEFNFRQLSVTRVSDIKAYIKRLIRYRLRDYQLAMLMHHFESKGIESIPETVSELYCMTANIPGYYWRGRGTLIDWIAVYHIRQKLR